MLTKQKTDLLVVGDKFHDFAMGNDIVTLSQLDLMTKIPSKVLAKNNTLVVGQGVRKDTISNILENYHHYNKQVSNIDLHMLLQERYPQGSNSYTHKKEEHNILIGKAQKVDKDIYNLPLMIDERCELMGDHQSGKHLQGMLLVEAFRQTFIAVTEEFYPFLGDIKKYFVINSLNINFYNFVFPIAANITYKVNDIDVNERREKINSTIEAWQNDILCASMEASFTVYPLDIISKKEAELAEKAIGDHFIKINSSKVISE
ncbi:AfsA-related hotdog domain-containing protein [Yersinia sp. 2540 StPb PI]|uniref:AfsA-related hotdog domain-containing protein n=1 Tax=Yersinia sp. 2540 StPb PI TaxID=3117406 RepID=UPI003FA413DD